MTETGTQTWHELAERVSDMENWIDEALSAYYRGATLDGVIDRVRKAQDSKVTGDDTEKATGEIWTDWIESPGNGICPVPAWAESVILAWSDSSVSEPCRYRMVSTFVAWDNDYLLHITHYCYAVPNDLAWLAENVDEWSLIHNWCAPDKKWTVPGWEKTGNVLWWVESPALDGFQAYTKKQWLRARRDLGYEASGSSSEIYGAGREQVGQPLEPAPDDPTAHYQGHHYRGVKMDPYRIADIYLIPAGPRWQILKKTLRGTSKGQSEQEVINEIRSALDRWQEMVEEDHG